MGPVLIMLPLSTSLFLATGEVETKRSRAELHRSVDADYYGYRDDEDGVLAPLELAVEQKGTIGLFDCLKSAAVCSNGRNAFFLGRHLQQHVPRRLRQVTAASASWTARTTRSSPNC